MILLLLKINGIKVCGLKLMKKHGDITRAIAEGGLKEEIPKLDELRRIFLEPRVTDDYRLVWGEFDRAGIIELLCEELKVERRGPELEHVRFLTSRQIREMAEAGVEFGGHTATHAILSRETPERVRTEVKDCRQHLESMTGRPVRCFAYPNGQRGDFNEMVKREVEDAGF